MLDLRYALNHVAGDTIICLREPLIGPVFGMKGGAAGGGFAQVVPMEDIKLHFTGDSNAIALADNLLTALVDKHIDQGNPLRFDPRRNTGKRVMEMNDCSPRAITIGPGGPANSWPREDGSDNVVAAEGQAIPWLATSMCDQKQRLARIVVGYSRDTGRSAPPTFARRARWRRCSGTRRRPISSPISRRRWRTISPSSTAGP